MLSYRARPLKPVCLSHLRHGSSRVSSYAAAIPSPRASGRSIADGAPPCHPPLGTPCRAAIHRRARDRTRSHLPPTDGAANRSGDPDRRLKPSVRGLYLEVHQPHTAARRLQFQRDGSGPVGPPLRGPPNDGSAIMTSKAPGTVKDGAHCQVIGGTHAGKSGIVRDVNTSKSGHIIITVVQANGERFKTLAKNVVIKPGTA